MGEWQQTGSNRKAGSAEFNLRQREAWLDGLASGRIYDLLVIGGGITGAGIALDAQLRGLRTLVVEMQDFAAGTSSRSTKLVHGGLRYLKQLEIGVVAEVGKERAIVYENGPHVTKPEWMLLPFYKGGTFGPLMTSVGLRVYDFLAGVKRSERRVMLKPEAAVQKEPLLKREGLRGGGYYVEYRTDDARLTIEVLKKAVEQGAAALSYMQADSLLYDNGNIAGAVLIDRLSGKRYEARAAKTVNAAGPWVDTLRELDGSKQGKTIHLTKGVHLVFDQSRFPLQQAVYFDTPDGRMIFAIPREGKTYIGTTDTNYKADMASPRMAEEDIRYLLEAANGMFPTLKLLASDVESGWAGLRPLVHQEGKSPSEISRKDEVFQSATGLISIAGGKLTGYRKMAEDVVNKAASQLEAEAGWNRKLAACSTRKQPISGGDVGGSRRYAAYIRDAAAEGVKAGLADADALLIARKYGTNAAVLFGLAYSLRESAVQSGIPLKLLAELEYAIRYEMAVKPADFWIRRTGNLLFDRKRVETWKEPVHRYMERLFGWSAAMSTQYAKELDDELHYARHPAAEQ
ncbi:glycerol-3-phosphate dehydrogenase/oxidase [Paenibacillus protaetiae]|uniref:Glycerol-3-phosphate dehydrogenase n=1 Tax=Paenibacillus protaetiae TaxID=2509456 RepID=A0A4P6ETM6_9BACL|nr:glycerol-3-phosphate dehydrogenase/oxidase [Paenibacillus protaetiae]QAY65996.1 glycerol-3-phosphate dehydrogenase/oxidase [Paenibacillus protaetiae]